MSGTTEIDPPAMSREFKRLLAIAVYAALPWLLLVGALVLLGLLKNGDQRTLYQLIFAFGVPICLANGFAVLYGLGWVLRHLRGSRRIRWAIAFFLGGFITACFWWWSLIRPLPEPAS
jgi:hypothetical protein